MSAPRIRWKCVRFEELSPGELYGLLALRAEVFVVEQGCAYLDIDGKDKTALHLLGYDGKGNLLACLRILPPGAAFNDVSIGRVAVLPTSRGLGIGKTLMQKGMECVRKEFGDVPVRVSAQAHLEKYYTGLGFKKVSKPYLEDGIPHIEMHHRSEQT